jgi:hypothetical protein
MKKLDDKKLGPFKVTKAISSHAYKIELPKSIKKHNSTSWTEDRHDKKKPYIHEVNLPGESLVLGQARSNSPSLVVPFVPTGTSPTHQSAEDNINCSYYLIMYSTRSISQVHQLLVI